MKEGNKYKMLNQVVLIGRLTKESEFIELENGKKVLNVLLAVPRSYKNENGEYDTDFIDCVLWEALAENTTEYCHKGDMVGIKGRVNTEYYEKDDDKIKIKNIVAEKVTFLSSKKRIYKMNIYQKIAINISKFIDELNNDETFKKENLNISAKEDYI